MLANGLNREEAPGILAQPQAAGRVAPIDRFNPALAHAPLVKSLLG